MEDKCIITRKNNQLDYIHGSQSNPSNPKQTITSLTTNNIIQNKKSKEISSNEHISENLGNEKAISLEEVKNLNKLNVIKIIESPSKINSKQKLVEEIDKGKVIKQNKIIDLLDPSKKESTTIAKENKIIFPNNSNVAESSGAKNEESFNIDEPKENLTSNDSIKNNKTEEKTTHNLNESHKKLLDYFDCDIKDITFMDEEDSFNIGSCNDNNEKENVELQNTDNVEKKELMISINVENFKGEHKSEKQLQTNGVHCQKNNILPSSNTTIMKEQNNSLDKDKIAKTKKPMNFRLAKKFIYFSVFLYLGDVLSDIFIAYSHLLDGNWLQGIATYSIIAFSTLAVGLNHKNILKTANLDRKTRILVRVLNAYPVLYDKEKLKQIDQDFAEGRSKPNTNTECFKKSSHSRYDECITEAIPQLILQLTILLTTFFEGNLFKNSLYFVQFITISFSVVGIIFTFATFIKLGNKKRSLQYKILSVFLKCQPILTRVYFISLMLALFGRMAFLALFLHLFATSALGWFTFSYKQDETFWEAVRKGLRSSILPGFGPTVWSLVTNLILLIGNCIIIAFIIKYISGFLQYFAIFLFVLDVLCRLFLIVNTYYNFLRTTFS